VQGRATPPPAAVSNGVRRLSRPSVQVPLRGAPEAAEEAAGRGVGEMGGEECL